METTKKLTVEGNVKGEGQENDSLHEEQIK